MKDRTTAPALFVLAAYLVALVSLYTLRTDILTRNWGNAAFALLNGLLTCYAIVAYIGVRNSVVDVVLGITHWVRVPVDEAPKSFGPARATAPDWESVLYYGPDHLGRAPGTPVAGPAPQRWGDTRARQRSE